MNHFKGRVLKRTDTPVERVWMVLIKWRPFWLSFEDFPLGMSLDAMNSFCNPVIRELHVVLSAEIHNKPMQATRKDARA